MLNTWLGYWAPLNKIFIVWNQFNSMQYVKVAAIVLILSFNSFTSLAFEGIGPTLIASMSVSQVQALSPAEVILNLLLLEAFGKIGFLTGTQVEAVIGSLSSNGLSQLEGEQLAYNNNINQVDDWTQLDQDELNDAVKRITGRNINMRGVTSGKFIGSELVNVKYADSFSVDNTATEKASDSQFESRSPAAQGADVFRVSNAEKVTYGCVTFLNVQNVDFEASPHGVKVVPQSRAPLKIIDCVNRQVEFVAEEGGYLSIIGDDYTVVKGTLTCTDGVKVDTLQAEESTEIHVGPSCFECMGIVPVGTYSYHEPVIERDFTVRIPKEGKVYRLCLRKFRVQSFIGYDGLADFVDKRMDFRGIMQYKRHLLRGGKATDILMETAYEGKADVRADITLFPEFIFVDTVALAGINASEAPASARTVPSNVYELTEEIIKGQHKRVLAVGYRLLPESLAQSLPSRYDSDGGLPWLNITSNVIMQDNGRHRVTILEPGNKKIDGIVG